MGNIRQDSLDRYYENLGFLNKLNSFSFGFSVVLSFCILFMDGHPRISSWINILFITITLVYFITNNYSSLYLMRDGENKRRTHLIANSFNVSLDSEETALYYNNEEEPSIRKLAAHTLENTLFTVANTEEMLKIERAKILVYLLIWFIVLLNRESSLEYLAVIGQTLFSTSILTNWIKLEILNNNCKKLYRELYNLFLQIRGETNLDSVTTARFIDMIMEYECLKAGMGISLSTKIFIKKINPKYTPKWNKIKKDLLIK